jgi:hypothetical protein
MENLMSANRTEILELLAAGKINAAEAADLLSNPVPAAPEAPEPPAAPEPVAVEMETVPEPVALKAAEKVVAATPVIEIEKEPVGAEQGNGRKPKWFRVRVKNLETGKNKVSVNLPLGMMKFGLKIGRQFTNDIPEMDWDELMNMDSGMIVEVEDDESNEHVQVFLE